MSPRTLLVVLALVLAACASDEGAAESSAGASSEAPETTAPAAPVDDEAIENDATGSDSGAGTDAEEDTAAGEAVDAQEATDGDTAAEEGEDEATDAEPSANESDEVDEPATRSFAPLDVDCSSIGRAGIGLQTGMIMSGGLEYKYQWTVPSSYDGTPIPVVLDFHAIGSNGAQQAVFGGWAALSESEGFLAVQPTGVAIPPDERASWELPQFDTDARDDVAMVRDLLDHVAVNVCIDPDRVYAIGMSNGGLFTSVVVCELADFVAAAVSVAGVTHDDSCDPERPVPYLAFHGTDDTTVPFRGGGETTLSGVEGGAFFEQVMPDEFAEFADDFRCAESTDAAVSESVTLTSYTGCADDVEMGFYTIDGGGHTWPGSPISAALPSLGVTTMEIDATALAWDFFQRHTL